MRHKDAATPDEAIEKVQGKWAVSFSGAISDFRQAVEAARNAGKTKQRVTARFPGED